MRRLSVIDTEPGATRPYTAFVDLVGGGIGAGVDCEGHLEIHNDIHNMTMYRFSLCQCYVFDAR